MNREERLRRIRAIDIYPVTCEELSEGRSNLEVLDAVLAGEARIVQLREKLWQKNKLYESALEFRKRTKRHGALLIINDHVDVALAAGADGVHLGQEDLPIEAARDIAPGLIIGASCHTVEEALRAEKQGADYVNIGPIFPTTSKPGAGSFLGTDAIGKIGPRLTIPFTTMGGINAENLRLVLEAGSSRAAMITGITRAPDITLRVRGLRAVMAEFDARINE